MAGFIFNFGKLEPIERLKRARIQIQQKNSFFGYMSLYLKFQSVDDKYMTESCGVDAEGNFYFKAKWIETLSDDELEGLMVHEIMHLVLLHLTRRRARHPLPWNIAADIVVNDIAMKNGYTLPKGGLITDGNHAIMIAGKKITEIDKKTSEQIYDELPITKIGIGGKAGKGEGEGFDKHIEGKNDAEKKEREDVWLQRAEDAAAKSMMKGDLPLGLSTMIKGLHKNQIHWRDLLVKYVQSYIPYDYTFNRCHKKSVSSGYYMPNYQKEKIKVLVGIDLSGSVGQKETADFMSEVVGLANAYQDRIEMVLLTHDVDVQDEYKIGNSVAEKLKKLKLHGGGGTSHKPIFKKIDEKYKDVKVAIFLTDAYSDLDEINLDRYSFAKLFVISKGGNYNVKMKGKHNIIKLGE